MKENREHENERDHSPFHRAGAALTSARTTVSVSPLYGSNMVIQRDKPFPVRGTASPNKVINVTYDSLTGRPFSDSG
jgi:hypothetical protein